MTTNRPGKGDLLGEPGPLGADGVLGDLAQDGLAGAQHLLDPRLAGAPGRLDVVGVVADVPVVEHGVLGRPDVDEGRLHARQHVLDPSPVDVAVDLGGVVRGPGDVVLDEGPALEQGDLGDLRAHVHADHVAADRLAPPFTAAPAALGLRTGNGLGPGGGALGGDGGPLSGPSAAPTTPLAPTRPPSGRRAAAAAPAGRPRRSGRLRRPRRLRQPRAPAGPAGCPRSSDAPGRPGVRRPAAGSPRPRPGRRRLGHRGARAVPSGRVVARGAGRSTRHRPRPPRSHGADGSVAGRPPFCSLPVWAYGPAPSGPTASASRAGRVRPSGPGPPGVGPSRRVRVRPRAASRPRWT